MVTVYDGWYLLDHHVNLHNGGTLPWYTVRRATVSAIVVHTPETLIDLTAPYDEAERVAKYGASTTRASWHDTVDADSIIPMLPPWYTAWQVRGYNSETIGMEIGAKATSWSSAPADWVTAVLSNAALRARQHADQYAIPIRFITRQQLDAGERGFTSHAQLDPERRSDPGVDFPWDRFLEMVEGDDMTPEEREFLGRLMANVEAAGSSPEFVKPTVELVRAHPGMVRSLNKKIAAAAAGGASVGAVIAEIVNRLS